MIHEHPPQSTTDANMNLRNKVHEKNPRDRKRWWRDPDGSLSWCARVVAYGISLILAIAAGIAVYCVVPKLEGDNISSWMDGQKMGPNFPTVVLATISALIFSIGRFIVKTFDDKLRFENDFGQRNEQEFSRAINLLANEGEDNRLSQSLGLRLLIKFRNNRNTSEGRQEYIDYITSSCIKIHGAKLRGAELRGADLRGAELQGADLRGAKLQEVDLLVARLQEVDLRGADLCGANLCKANLCKADLRGADLEEVCLDKAIEYGEDGPVMPTGPYGDHDGIDLKDAKYNSRTKFPKGFDPDKHGMCKD